MKHGEVTVKILEAVAGVAVDIVDVFGAILAAGYGSSSEKIAYKLRKGERIRAHEMAQRKTQQRYYSMLYKLKQQGLIIEKKNKNKTLLRITKLGKERLAILKIKYLHHLPPRSYTLEKDQKKFIIVAFDIPERDKRMRNWLRDVLRGFGMDMIQKSVWAGKVSLPKTFLDDLKHYQLLNYVEIFEISKTGSVWRV